MNILTKELLRLREDDPNVSLILNVFEEIERVYREALEAMGVTAKPQPEVRNSAEVTISFRSTPSSSTE